MPLSDNIKKFRKLRKLSVTAMAKELGVSRQTIYDWEAGKYKPDLDVFDKLAKLLGVLKPALLGEESTPDEQAVNNVDYDLLITQKKYIAVLEEIIRNLRDEVDQLKGELNARSNKG